MVGSTSSDGKGKAPVFLPAGYRDRKNATTDGVAKSGEVAAQGTVTHVEHWDGSVDAVVRPRPVSMKLRVASPDGADPDPDHVAAIAAFEKAQRRLDFARASGDPSFIRRAESVMYAAQQRLQETQ